MRGELKMNIYLDIKNMNKMKIKLHYVYNEINMSICTEKSRKFCENNTCMICFNKSFASHEKAEFWADKNKLIPRYIFKCAGKKVWFNCNCGHEFEISLAHVKEGKWCPYCVNQKLCENDNCQTCFTKSFANHEKAEFWSDKNIKTARQSFLNSNLKCWFNCPIPECNHEFETSLRCIVQSGRWCPYCSNQKLCDDNNCQICFIKSFSSYKKAKYWSKRNDSSPRQVSKSTGKSFWFDCKCGHEFNSSLNSITREPNGSWCPYCCYPPNKLCKDENCKQCFNKSFASHEKRKFWSDKNNLQPIHVFKSSWKNIIFNCENGHEFKAVLSSITSGQWCPYCRYKTEQKLYEWMLKRFDEVIKRQKKFHWCKNIKSKRKLPFDFYIKRIKLIIELDGRQHFKQVANWDSPETTLKNDIKKMAKAINNGMTVIRISQEDVCYDRIDWKMELEKVILNYKKPKIFYIASNPNLYDNHKTAIENIRIKRK